MSINFKSEEEVNEYLENLGIEYRFGCLSEKNPEVCHLLGEYLDTIKKDYHKAARIYKLNCDDENFPRSCHSYGTYLATGRGVDKKNADEAIDYFNKACSLGVSSSCFNAGMLTINPLPGQKREKDYTKGLYLLDKSCNLKNSHACYFLSGIYIQGLDGKEDSIKKDMKRAFEYSEKACNLDHLYGCMNLRVMYKKGEGCEKNEEMANKVNQKVEDIKEQMNRMTLEFQRGGD